MTIRKYTAQELACGAVQVWTKAQYKIELAKCTPGYYVRVYEGRTSHVDRYTRLSDAHTAFNKLVRYWDAEYTVRTITNRLMYSICPSYALETSTSNGTPNGNPDHQFEYDSMDGATVCIYCGLVKGQV